MNYLKKLGRVTITTLLSIIILGFILTIFYYFNIIDNNIYNIMKLIIILASIFVNSFILGKISTKYGFVEGLKLGAIILVIMLIMKIISGSSFDIRTFIYSIIILLTSSIGSVIGINKKVSD